MSKFQPRRASPGASFTYTDGEGSQVELRANEEGVVTPRTPAEEVLLNGFGLPVARKAEAEQKSKERD